LRSGKDGSAGTFRIKDGSSPDEYSVTVASRKLADHIYGVAVGECELDAADVPTQQRFGQSLSSAEIIEADDCCHSTIFDPRWLGGVNLR
jgi:hypothetical protein